MIRKIQSNLTKILVTGGPSVLENPTLSYQKLQTHHTLQVGVSHIGELVPLRWCDKQARKVGDVGASTSETLWSYACLLETGRMEGNNETVAIYFIQQVLCLYWMRKISTLGKIILTTAEPFFG